MKKTLKNAQMAEMLLDLQPLLSQRNKVGYIAARNYRILSGCLTEYLAMRHRLIDENGEEFTDDKGFTNHQIKIGTPAFTVFSEAMAPLNEIEQEVDLMTIKYDEIIGILSGEEILRLSWMLED